VIIDGNRDNRPTIKGKLCSNWTGDNMAWYCDNCHFLNSVTMNALCGSGLQVHGRNFLTSMSLYLDNGGPKKKMFANGLSCFDCVNATIENSFFQGNSAFHLLVSQGPFRIEGNIFLSSTGRTSWAAIYLVSIGKPGNFVSSTVTGNTVECNTGCCFGIQIGSGPFSPTSSPISGGTIENNNISGAGVLINVQRAGTLANPVVLGENALWGQISRLSLYL